MKRAWVFGMLGGALLVMVPALAQKDTAGEAAGVPVVGEVPAEKGVKVETWVSGLAHPWGLAFLPDGRALVTERAGRLRIIDAGGKLSAPLAGVPEVLNEGQGGLLDVTIDPQFAENGVIYLSYARGMSDSNGLAVARGRLTDGGLRDVQVILDNPVKKSGGQHFGSRFAWLADGSLLVSVADGGNPPLRIGKELARFQGQNAQTINGAVIRITRDGKPAPDNPDFGAEAEPRLWTMGHRNPQGLTVDAKTGAVWATEHGSRGGDELNLLRAGGNYGWPKVSYSREYTSADFVAPVRTLPGFVDPASVWTPSIGASGLAVYRGEAFPGWDGNLLAGGLVSKDVRRIVIGADNKPTGETAIPIGDRVRDVRVGSDGFIYVLTDEEKGRILRLRPAAG